jgi:hypothetical protein
MNKITLIAFVAAIVAYQATTTSASASSITYELVGVSANFANNTETDVFSGTFTLDLSTFDLSAVSITVSGPVVSGTFTTPLVVSSSLLKPQQIEFSDGGSNTWIMQFLNIFADASNPLSAVFDSASVLTNGVTGEAVPETPLPAALPLFATGLGALGLLGWRRKRKAAAIAA